jgi:hypothetical protein
LETRSVNHPHQFQTRDAEADRLDPAQVVPGAAQVEDRLGQGHEALAGGLQAQKGLGLELTA